MAGITDTNDMKAREVLGRGLLIGGMVGCLMAFSAVFLVARAFSADFFVTAQIRDFPMKSGETPFRDYYINAGTNNGLRNSIYLDAVRRVPAYDNINNKILGDTMVRVARLKVIHIDRAFAVARLVRFYEKEKTPLTGFDAVMIGDLVEVSEAQSEKP